MLTADHNFKTLSLSAALLTAVEKCGYDRPTPIQARAIPAMLAGRDLCAQAPTGSGKTAAFGLPLLQRILQQREQPKPIFNGNQVSNLVLAPTRELAQQIEMDLINYASAITPKIKILSCVGGLNITPQMLALRGGADVLVATPGRLIDLVQQNAVKFAGLKTLVLDEADQLLQLGFSAELAEIIKLLPVKRQNVLFSATFPLTLDQLIAQLLVNPTRISCADTEQALIEQRAVMTAPENKNALLARMIHEGQWPQVLVFVNAKNTCNHLVLKLAKRGVEALALHGDKSQSARMQALKGFKDNNCRVLIATDLAARGIDIENLPVVINFDLPRSPNDYVHRIGRTGRAGVQGLAISLLCETDEAHFRVIEKRMKSRVPRETFEDLVASGLFNVNAAP